MKKKGKGAKKHIGFKGAVDSIKKGGKYSDEEAGAIAASAARNASPEAKAVNPFLNKVKGKAKK
jgi:hypothetical protein